jgi:hypothetical protein
MQTEATACHSHLSDEDSRALSRHATRPGAATAARLSGEHSVALLCASLELNCIRNQ